MMGLLRLTRFSCGHVGRMSAGVHAKAQAFIKVAEIRSSHVDESTNNCPHCNSKD